MTNMRQFPIVLVSAVAACTAAPVQPPTSSQIDLSVGPAHIAPGGIVQLSLANNSSAPLGFNLCFSSLERREGPKWTLVLPTSSDVCQAYQQTLAPGRLATRTLQLELSATPGSYRVQTHVEAPVGGGNLLLVSNAFEVQR
jgi:hypothetical protein